MTAVDERPQVAPDGFLLGDPEPQSPAWFKLRQGGITATDLPLILGLSQYGNARTVWHDKRGELPPEIGESTPARWGRLLEDVIAQEWAREHSTAVERIGVLANAEAPWIRASLDRRVVGCPDGDGPCGLEVKNRAAWVGGAWRDDVPDSVLAQVTWQMITSGYRHMHVACLIGGNEPRWFRIAWDDDLATYLVDSARPVWEAVSTDVGPEVDADQLLADLLDRLHPNRSGVLDMGEDDVRALVAPYNSACDVVKAAEAVKAGARARILDRLGALEEIDVDGRRVVSYRKSADGEAFDSNAWKRLVKSDAEAAQQIRDLGLVVPRQGSRTFYLANDYRTEEKRDDE